jgi:hypothetical protein
VKYSVESKVVKCGVQRMACGEWRVDCGVRSLAGKVHKVQCVVCVWSAVWKCRVWSSKSEVQSAEWSWECAHLTLDAVQLRLAKTNNAYVVLGANTPPQPRNDT